jgi:hypothetical protein
MARRLAICSHPTGALFRVKERYARIDCSVEWRPEWRGCTRCARKETAALTPCESDRFKELDELTELVPVVTHAEGLRRLEAARSTVRRFAGAE